jgi:hypothetical protein
MCLAILKELIILSIVVSHIAQASLGLLHTCRPKAKGEDNTDILYNAKLIIGLEQYVRNNQT